MEASQNPLLGGPHDSKLNKSFGEPIVETIPSKEESPQTHNSYPVCSIANGLMAIGFSVMPQFIHKTYDQSLFMINIISIIYLILYVPVSIAAVYLLDEKSIRLTLFIAIILILFGSWIRMLINISYSFVIVGQTLSAIANPMILAIPAKLTERWFPPSQRGIATGIEVASSYVGMAVGCLLPLFFIQNSYSDEDVAKHDALIFLLTNAIIISALTIFVLIFFREKPPTCPSMAEEVNKIPFKKGIIDLFKRKDYILMFLGGALALSNMNTLVSTFCEIILPFDYPESDCKYGGFLLYFFTLVGEILTGIFTDATHRFKFITVGSCLCSFLCTGLIVVTMVFHTNVLVYIMYCLIGFCFAPMCCLTYEYTVELAFPIGEALSAGLISALSSLISLAQILINSHLLNTPTQKKAYYCIGIISMFCFISLVLTCFIKGKLHRLEFEKENLIDSEQPKTRTLSLGKGYVKSFKLD